MIRSSKYHWGNDLCPTSIQKPANRGGHRETVSNIGFQFHQFQELYWVDFITIFWAFQRDDEWQRSCDFVMYGLFVIPNHCNLILLHLAAHWYFSFVCKCLLPIQIVSFSFKEFIIWSETCLWCFYVYILKCFQTKSCCLVIGHIGVHHHR